MYEISFESWNVSWFWWNSLFLRLLFSKGGDQSIQRHCAKILFGLEKEKKIVHGKCWCCFQHSYRIKTKTNKCKPFICLCFVHWNVFFIFRECSFSCTCDCGISNINRNVCTQPLQIFNWDTHLSLFLYFSCKKTPEWCIIIQSSQFNCWHNDYSKQIFGGFIVRSSVVVSVFIAIKRERKTRKKHVWSVLVLNEQKIGRIAEISEKETEVLTMAVTPAHSIYRIFHAKRKQSTS